MIKLIWDANFKRSYKKRIGSNKPLKKKFGDAINVFCHEPFNTKLKTHKLTGKLKDLWAFSVSYDCRVIFMFIDTETALLVDIGSHEEVY
jgi:addiction module RelE/StbE family toxin